MSASYSDHMSVSVGAGAVWTTLEDLNAVVRVDPATNRVAARIHVSNPCGFMAADEHALWIAGAHCAGAVTRLDARTNRPTGVVRGGPSSPIGIGLGFGSLWVADLDSKAIDRIDLRTRRIAGRLPVGGYPVRLAIGFGSVWVQDDQGRVLRIKPQG